MTPPPDLVRALVNVVEAVKAMRANTINDWSAIAPAEYVEAVDEALAALEAL